MRDKTTGNRNLLFIVVAVLVTVIVLASAFDLLPPPPFAPTPTPPQVLDRPEGLPRLEQ